MPTLNIFRPLYCFIASLLLLPAILLRLQAQQRADLKWNWISDSLRKEFGPIVLRQRLGENQFVGVDASSTCQECEEYGIRHQLVRVDEFGWKLVMEVIDSSKLQKIGYSKWLNVDISMMGRDGTVGAAIVRVAASDSDLLSDLFEFLEREPEITTSVDQQIADDIRHLREFRNRSIAIYETRGEARENIFKSYARMDSIPLRRIDSICATIGTRSMHNCLDTVLKVYSDSHGNRTTFRETIAEMFGIGMGDADKAEQKLQTILSIGLSALSARESRPKVIYLIVSNERDPVLIGMARGRQNQTDSSYMMIIGHPLISSDLRHQLGFLYPDEAKDLRQQLQQAAELQASDLVKIWPNEESSVDIEKRRFFPDIEAGRLIRDMKDFAGRPIAIYEIQGDLLRHIIQHREARERADVNSIESLCQTLYDDPLSDCFNTTLGIIRSAEADFGRDMRVFRGEFARRYRADPKRLDSIGLVEIRSRVMELMQRRAGYPEFFYLVTTDEARQEPLAMVLLKEESRDPTFDLDDSESSDPTRTVALHSVFTGSALRKQLDDIHPDAMQLLLRQLPGAKNEDSLWEDIDLVKIWPKKQPKE
jgi:hypothetical protein